MAYYNCCHHYLGNLCLYQPADSRILAYPVRWREHSEKSKTEKLLATYKFTCLIEQFLTTSIMLLPKSK